MKKHLKLQGVWVPEKKMVRVTLLERTHTGYGFSVNSVKPHYVNGTQAIDKGFGFTVAHVTIASDGSKMNFSAYVATWLKGTGQTHILFIPDYLRSHSPEEERSCYVSNEDWQVIKKCAEEYNNFDF